MEAKLEFFTMLFALNRSFRCFDRLDFHQQKEEGEKKKFFFPEEDRRNRKDWEKNKFLLYEESATFPFFP